VETLVEQPNDSDIVYDWNAQERVAPLSREGYQFYDETLRDGVQSPTVTDPPVADKIEILHLMESLGIHCADIGLPGAGVRAEQDVLHLAQEIQRSAMKLRPSCAARTHAHDIRPIIEISQKTGQVVEIMAFIGSSPIRQYAEDWDLDRMLRMSADAIDMGVKEGLPVTYVTEDTTRSRPDTLDRLFRNAINHGAHRLCICDTVGHATPDGVFNVIRFTRSIIRAMNVSVGVDWHGHNDRGLAVTNSIHAIEAGATRIHGTALGVGERVGNAALDQILFNLKLLGEIPWDLSNLLKYCHKVSAVYGTPIPFNYPLAGRDAFRTATGVHASAIIKAERKGDAWLADRIYSGVPAGMFGREQEIEIGHMSGESNVIYWLRKHGVEPRENLVQHIFKAAKAANHTLSEEEIRQLISELA
jgi:2-isopropylmalate synthase